MHFLTICGGGGVFGSMKITFSQSIISTFSYYCNIASYFKHTTAFYIFAIMLKTQRLGSTGIESPFCLDTIRVFCTCKYYNMETMTNGKCCKHIIGQLRRVVLGPPMFSGPFFTLERPLLLYQTNYFVHRPQQNQYIFIRGAEGCSSR